MRYVMKQRLKLQDLGSMLIKVGVVGADLDCSTGDNTSIPQSQSSIVMTHDSIHHLSPSVISNKYCPRKLSLNFLQTWSEEAIVDFNVRRSGFVSKQYRKLSSSYSTETVRRKNISKHSPKMFYRDYTKSQLHV